MIELLALGVYFSIGIQLVFLSFAAIVAYLRQGYPYD